MEKDYSLLIAASVAIVAITGLVFYFGGATEGAAYSSFITQKAPHYPQFSGLSEDGEIGRELGNWVADGWNANYGEQNTYCSAECGNTCRNAYETGKTSTLGGDCYGNCKSACNTDLLAEAGFSK